MSHKLLPVLAVLVIRHVSEAEVEGEGRWYLAKRVLNYSSQSSTRNTSELLDQKYPNLWYASEEGLQFVEVGFLKPVNLSRVFIHGSGNAVQRISALLPGNRYEIVYHNYSATHGSLKWADSQTIPPLSCKIDVLRIEVECTTHSVCLRIDGISIYGYTECIQGMWGRCCDNNCGHCWNDGHCDDKSGICPKTGGNYRCATGYNGSNCDQDVKHTTRRLWEIADKDIVTLETASSLLSETADLSKDATQAVDVVTISRILHKSVNVGALNRQAGQKLGEIVNSVIAVHAEQNGASRRIIQSLETYALTANLSGRTYARLTFENLVMEMWDLDEDVIVTGIKALTVDEEHSGGVPETDNSESPFYYSVETVRDDDHTRRDGDFGDIEVAILLKTDVVKREIQARSLGKLRLSFVIQKNDVLFREPLQNKTGAVGSRIISASFNNLTLKNLPKEDRVQVIFKPLSENISDKLSTKCVFWDYNQFDGKGGWSTEGCSVPKLEQERYVCLCNHLTNFAILFELGDVDVDLTHESALSTITLVGLSLSLIGVGITIATMLQFRSLRADMSQKVFFNLAVALMLTWTLFLVGVVMSLEKVQHEVGCKILAVCLHYSLLVSFMWMLIEAAQQYLRYVKVLGTHISHFVIKASIVCWGLPAIPVVILLSVDHHLYYRGDGSTPPRFCWMDQYASYFAFLLPVGLIMIFNMAIFICVAWKLSRRSPVLINRKLSLKESKLRVKAGVACFLLLGLTWVFGYLTIEDARIPFQYIFTILNAFHGFFIFLFFVLPEKRFRDMLCGVCRKTNTGTSSAGTRYGNSGKTNVKSTQPETEEISLSTI